jgi:hypothetical protein
VAHLRSLLAETLGGITSHPSQDAALISNWLLSVFDPAHRGTISAIDLIGSLGLLGGRATETSVARRYDTVFLLLNVAAGGLASLVHVREFLTSVCKMLFMIGEAASMGVSPASINATMALPILPMDGNLSARLFIEWACDEQNSLLAWYRVLVRLVAGAVEVNKGHCIVPTCVSAGLLNGLVFSVEKVRGGGMVCERCFIECNESGKYHSGKPVREFTRRLTTVDRTSEMARRVKNLGLSTKANRVIEDERAVNERRRAFEDYHRSPAPPKPVARAATVAGATPAAAPVSPQASAPRVDPALSEANYRVSDVYDQETHALIAQFAAQLAQQERRAEPVYFEPPRGRIEATTTTASESETDTEAAAAAAARRRAAASAPVKRAASVSIETQTASLDAEFGPVFLPPPAYPGSTKAAAGAAASATTVAAWEASAASAPPGLTGGVVEDEFSAQDELMNTSVEIEAVIAQLSRMSDESSTSSQQPYKATFGEQLLHAARGVANSTSALVLQVAAVKRAVPEASASVGSGDAAASASASSSAARPESALEINEWTRNINLQAARMHEAARALCDVLTRDQFGEASEDEVLKTAAAVSEASEALLSACQVTPDDRVKTPPLFVDSLKEARRSAVESRNMLALVADRRSKTPDTAARQGTPASATAAAVSEAAAAAAAAALAVPTLDAAADRSMSPVVAPSATVGMSRGPITLSSMTRSSSSEASSSMTGSTGVTRSSRMSSESSDAASSLRSIADVKVPAGRQVTSTLKRKSLYNQTMSDRWLKAFYGLEEVAGVCVCV